MNYSEADCLGLLVRRSGQDTVLYLCVINASHFSTLALLMFIIRGKRSLQVMDMLLKTSLHTGES